MRLPILIGVLLFLVSFIAVAQPGNAQAALTLNNFVGWETGGTDECIAGTGGTVSDLLTPHSGDYSSRYNNNSWCELPIITGGSTDSDNDFILGHWQKGNASSPTAEETRVDARDDNGGVVWALSIEADDDLVLRDAAGTLVVTVTAPFQTDSTWELVEIRWQHSASGAFDMHLDGVSIISETGVDLTDGNAIVEDDAVYRFQNTSSSSDQMHIDDVYMYSGASGTGDFLGGAEVFRYQANTNSATPSSGNDLSAGVWQDLGETPLAADGTEPGYSNDASADTGIMYTDDTQSGNHYRPGPSEDSLSGTIKGGKWFLRARRGNGSGTEHYMLYGNDVDTINTTADLVLGTAFDVNYWIISTAPGAVPLSTEHFAIGMGDQAVGARDMFGQEMFAFILHVPAAGGARRIFTIE